VSDDLDLRGIDQRHEPDPEFRSALRRRVAAIVADTDPSRSSTNLVELATIDYAGADGSASPEVRRARWMVRAAVGIAAAAAILVAIVVVSRDGRGPSTGRIIPSVPALPANGWVAFSAGEANLDDDVYLVRKGSSPRRIAGSDTDNVDQVCPAFSPDGTRILYGQATGNQRDGYRDPGLAISDVGADGSTSRTTTIALQGLTLPPCANWSPDGRWVAFGVETGDPSPIPDRRLVDQVWVVDTETGAIRRLTDLSVTDLEWAPSGTDLAIASNGISIYSVATDHLSRLGADGAQSISWAPDGSRIAFEKLRPGSTEVDDLWLINTDGTDERILAGNFIVLHGVGPVWSPDGSRIAYQRVCARRAEAAGVCREQHEVVLVTVDQHDPQRPVGTQVVISPPETSGPNGPVWWYPWSVTWSPDGTALLYVAWPSSTSEVTTEPRAILAVSVDGKTPPVVLSGDSVAVYSGFPWLTIQSWGRQPGQ
jgi:hypothetical protein